jgi:hypothetical protein
VPLGASRFRLVQVTGRGIGMTFAAALFWLAMRGAAPWAGLDPPRLATFFGVSGARVYPLGRFWNRASGGDPGARGGALRGRVAAITPSRPLPVASGRLRTGVVAFAVSARPGAHFLPYGGLYRTPASRAVVGVGAAVQARAGWANVAIPASVAMLDAVAGLAARQRSRHDGLHAHAVPPC